MANADLNIRILLKDLASKGIRTASKALDDIESAGDKATKGLRGFERGLKDLGDGGNKASNFIKDFGSAMLGVNQALEVAKKVAMAAKAAFEFSREGASVRQLTESFSALNDKLNVAPENMQKMRDAARGTVSDVTLMSSVLTLVAGETDQMAKSMMEAAPQLIEIAKAANKLNPALGDTDFFVDSIFKGIKRGQPLILDNLGIVVSIADANKKYAEQLGKTVEQLDDADKRQALLNATMEAGQKIIKQAGDNTESLVDSYDRLTASWENYRNSLAESTVGLGKVVGETAEMVDGMTDQQRAMQTLHESYKAGLVPLGKYIDLLLDGQIPIEEWYDAIKKLRKELDLYKVSLQGVYTVVMEGERDELNEIDRAYRIAAERRNGRDAMRDYINVYDIYAYTLEEVAVAEEEYIANKNLINATTAALNGTLDEQIQNLADMQAEYDSLSETDKNLDIGINLSGDIAKGLEDVNRQLEVMFTKQAVLNLLNSGLEGAEQAAYDLAFELGMIDSTTYNAMTTLTNFNDYLQDTGDVEGYGNAVAYINDNLNGLHDVEFTVTQTLETIYKERRIATPPTNDSPDEWYANGTGGQFLTVPPGHPNDSYTIGLTSGEQYLVRSNHEVAGGGNVSTGGVGIGGQIVININNPIVTDEDSFKRMVEPAVIEVYRRQEAIRGGN